MNDNVPEQLYPEWERIKRLTDEELDAELVETMEVSAKMLVRLALIVRQKEERGHDLSGITTSMLTYLRKIAYGQLLPEAVSCFLAHPTILKRIAALPIPDQRKCIQGGGVRIACFQGDQVTHRMADLTLLGPSELSQVFASDHIRSVDEQAALLKANDTSPVPQRPEPPPYTIAGNHLIVLRPVRLSKRDIQKILAAMES
jgi:hypothetical protein